MLNYEIIQASYDNNTKVNSIIIKGANGELYQGISKPREDQTHVSQMRGGEIAELKALIKYMKAEAKRYEELAKKMPNSRIAAVIEMEIYNQEIAYEHYINLKSAIKRCYADIQLLSKN